MLIYEKNNKLNINFDPSKSIEGTPDIQIGENEIKLGDAEITSENVLPTPTNEDVGKVPTVKEDGSYALANAGGGDFRVTFSVDQNDSVTCDKTYSEIAQAILDKKNVYGYAERPGGGTLIQCDICRLHCKVKDGAVIGRIDFFAFAIEAYGAGKNITQRDYYINNDPNEVGLTTNNVYVGPQ
jgi:hypothetical protein